MTSKSTAIKAGWIDNRTSYTTTINADGKKRITGHYYCNDIQFNFSLNETSGGPYLFRGRISLISPVDGFVLQVQGKQRRQIIARSTPDKKEKAVRGERLEELNASRQLYISTTDECAIKMAITKAADWLCGNNSLALEDILRKSAPTVNMHSAQARRLYAKRYFAKSTANATTTHRKDNILLSICGRLDGYTMGEITVPVLHQLHKELDNKADEQFHVAQGFWAFCRDQAVYQGSNPFDLYYSKYPRTKLKKADLLVRRALTPTKLSFDIEKKINQIIVEGIADGRNIGLMLVKDVALPCQDACALKWNQVIFDDARPDYVQIVINKKDTVGATHNYTRPCYPFVARVLRERYQFLRKSYSALKIEKMYVAASKDGANLKQETKDLTAYIRNKLMQAGIGYAALQPRVDSVYGSGTQLLLDNFRNKLITECGLDEERGAVTFLMGHALLDVTSDNYRSFTCPEGQEFLFTALCRDGRFDEQYSNDDDIKVALNVLSDASVSAVVPAAGPNRVTRTSAVIHLQPGQHLHIASPHGVIGELKVRKLENGQAKQSKHINTIIV